METKIRDYAISVLIALGVGALAAYFTEYGMRTLYAEIRVPVLSPPSALFPVVWTILYFLMGVSAAMIWRERSPETAGTRRISLILYGLSLAVNFSWCFVFFGGRFFGFALVWLLVLLALVGGTVFEYRKISAVASCLQIPYVLWLCFAGYLTCAIWILNP